MRAELKVTEENLLESAEYTFMDAAGLVIPNVGEHIQLPDSYCRVKSRTFAYDNDLMIVGLIVTRS